MSLATPLDRIWYTYKARINAERRFKNYALLSHLALSWYAFLGIVFAIYQDSFALYLTQVGAVRISLVISVLTFGLSLIIYGFKFDDLARTHRECYLRMQAIYQGNSSDADKLAAYSTLLDHYPNHAPRDHVEVIVDGWRRGVSLSDTAGNAVILDRIGWGLYFLRHTVWWVAAILVFVAPLALGAYWLR